MSSNTSQPLPVELFRSELLATIASHPVTIVCAETGAGKSTQIPLWFFQDGQKVIVTQPRRIAARALSRYMSEQCRLTWGEEIGYQTGTDQRRTRRTRLLYVTDGVQMINEIRGKRDRDLLILDEIHEWNLSQEILIGQVKRDLMAGRKSRVVIMSATLSSQRLSRFLGNAPVITIPGRGFPVSRHTHHPGFILSDVAQLIQAGQNVLVFQPGKSEINAFSDQLRDALKEDRLKAEILPLHSELTIKEQARVFQHTSIPKVVVATDVAQTSLTIDDIDAVVDTGIKKELRLINGIEGLYPTEISQAECSQRAGRAGRTRPGQYILCSEQDIGDRPAFPEPEITRLNMDSVVLRMLKWGLLPDEFPFFHPPHAGSVRKSLGRLITFGALNRDLSLTHDGEKMADLPVSLRSARMLIEGMKGTPELLGDTMRLIALIETRGIADSAALPARIHPLPLRSDLLNQLYIWKNIRLYRSMIQRKKLSQAQEIFNELKKRVPLATRHGATPSTVDGRQIMRICLSAFPDHVYEQFNQRYCSENEERQLDRHSSLNETPPAMVTGLPFDLLLLHTDPVTGEEKPVKLSLISLASELSWELLADLKPFSFRVHSEYAIEESRIRVNRTYFFGGKKLLTRLEPPDWQNQAETAQLLSLILDWLTENRPPDLRRSHTELEQAYLSAQTCLGETWPPFSQVIRDRLTETIRSHLDHDDLNYFFQFHSSTRADRLADILSEDKLDRLKKGSWPRRHLAGGVELPIIWQSGRPYIQVNPETILLLQPESLVLSTGIRAGILFQRRRYRSWPQLVTAFNRRQKIRIFDEKWATATKPVNADELKKLVFPLAYIGGRGLDNQPFEYFISPDVDGESLLLRHFLTREEAESHYQSIQPVLSERLRRHEQQSLSDLFKKKGWTVR